ncbi:MAG: NADH-quinone oxidoreductase subunit N, partial [Chloroflexi bacterium]|nr:NADH-quinone oxidoreductase subunit N [Chloroflexota bacterium]
MGITGKDLFLIAPELALVVAATVVVLSGLVSRQRQLTLGLALLGLAATFAFGIALWDDVHANGAQSAFNDSLIVDKFALYVKFLVAGTAALVLIAGLEYAERFRPYESEFSGLVLFSASGLMLLAAAADLITIYVSLELATLPVVALAAFVRMRVAPIEAGVKYLLLSAVSSAFLLYGFAFLYGASGTMQVVSSGSAPTIAQSLAAGTAAVPFGGLAVMAGAVLATAGFGFKLSMVPFQMWTPDVYEGAPTPVGAFLATASKAAAFAVVLRLFYEALGGSSADWSTLFAALAAITMTI